MDELRRMKARVSPSDTLLVVDAMTGQEAAGLVKTFNDQVDLTGGGATPPTGGGQGARGRAGWRPAVLVPSMDDGGGRCNARRALPRVRGRLACHLARTSPQARGTCARWAPPAPPPPHACCPLRPPSTPGAILTKLDGDSRGGAALSVREVSGAPIKFVGTGETMDALEPFYPERMANRILGMGDMLTLYEKAQEAFKVRACARGAEGRGSVGWRVAKQADAQANVGRATWSTSRAGQHSLNQPQPGCALTL